MSKIQKIILNILVIFILIFLMIKVETALHLGRNNRAPVTILFSIFILIALFIIQRWPEKN